MTVDSARLNVGVVGPGRAGSVLAAALARAGHHVVAAYAVSEESKQRAGDLLPDAVIMEIEQVFERSDLVLLTVPDDALISLAVAIADNGWCRSGQFVAHSSGSHGIGALDPLTENGALPLALHPAMTFNGSSMDVDRLTGCPFGVTAPDDLIPVATALVVEMGGEPMLVAESKRSEYHAALAHGSNHLVTLINDAMSLLSDSGVERPDKFLAPLVGAALDNSLRYGDEALTGPVSRGDASTVAKHLAILEQQSPRMAATYRAMALRTAERAMAAQILNPVAAAEIMAVLGE
ncbi:MAG: oxidoreductase [Micrococcales bacterium]|nr:oxidoreductase [Micrococcales bacterium]